MPASASRLVCSTLCFRHLPLEDAAAAIVASGFSCCDLVGLPGYCEHFAPDAVARQPVEAWARCLRRAPLRVHRLQTALPLWHEPGVEPHQIAAAALRCFEMACAVGAGGVVFGVGRAQDRPARDPGALIAETAGRFSPLAAAAAARGLSVSFEVPHRGSLVHTAGEALALVETCAQPNVGLIFDVAHQLRAGLPLVEAVRLLARHIDHVHLRDQRAGKGCYPLGTGDVDFGALFHALEIAGYKGAFCLEFPDGATTAAEVVALLRASRDYLRIHFSLT